ncbi:hypothetical protein JSQ81_19970 [Sporosarcina sp. Marseille-Q4063]|uniref:SGNH/GDSL hydrolase family protein n=1 Tax=Sporosarcina sp. Marseille-Q4063 TaxID=2810514 RepID=UPI001BAE7310|nr:GDSL-type esterase/lipase family protein [Sporosarcina sp. Marseille-Q4063]QUW22013.1 hypothetical protein JSQ81_19970 [Sporosarcina sp. Marseille-Q4063]
MQKVIKQSRALLLMLAFLLAFAPMSALAGSGEKQTVNYVSLGDSLAAGMLHDRSISPGFAGEVESELKLRGYDIKPGNNYGVPGFTSHNVIAGLLGIKELESADIITISVGANDVLMGLDVANLDLLIPGKLDGLKNAANDAATTATLTTGSAMTSIDVAEEPVNTAKLAVVEGQEAVNVVKNAIDLNMAILPPEVKLALVTIYDDIEEASNRVEKANDELISAKEMFATNPITAATELETLENDLSAAKQKLESVVTNIGIIETFIAESSLPIPLELKAAVLNVKEKAIQAALDAGNAVEAVQNAKEAVNLATEAQIAAKTAGEKVATAAAKAMELTQVIAKIPDKIQEVGVNMSTILGTIKAANPNVKIYVMGYYNALPYLPPEVQQTFTLQFLDGLNKVIEDASNHFDATFISTFDAFEGNYEVYLPNPKDIHPSLDGYKAIANEFMKEIGESYPVIVSEEPGEVIIDLNEKVDVYAGQKVLINDTDVSLLLPKDLPEGTTLTVTLADKDALAKAKGLKDVGDVLNFTFEFPEGFEKYEGKFTLVMGYDADESFDVDIYYFDEEKDAWVAKEGKVNKEAKEISVDVKHFSNYGVFAQIDVDKEKPPVTEKPDDDDDKTPPVVKTPDKNSGKDPTKGSDSTKKPTPKPTKEGSKLPKTATNNFSLLLFGTILLVTGVATLVIRPKKVLS